MNLLLLKKLYHTLAVPTLYVALYIILAQGKGDSKMYRWRELERPHKLALKGGATGPKTIGPMPGVRIKTTPYQMLQGERITKVLDNLTLASVLTYTKTGDGVVITLL